MKSIDYKDHRRGQEIVLYESDMVDSPCPSRVILNNILIFMLAVYRFFVWRSL